MRRHDVTSDTGRDSDSVDAAEDVVGVVAMATVLTFIMKTFKATGINKLT